MISDVWQSAFVKIDKEAENDELRKKCADLEAKNSGLVSTITLIKELAKKSRNDVKPKRILKNGDYMTVLWEDGTKTIVKRAAAGRCLTRSIGATSTGFNSMPLTTT